MAGAHAPLHAHTCTYVSHARAPSLKGTATGRNIAPLVLPTPTVSLSLACKVILTYMTVLTSVDTKPVRTTRQHPEGLDFAL